MRIARQFLHLLLALGIGAPRIRCGLYTLLNIRRDGGLDGPAEHKIEKAESQSGRRRVS